MTRQQRYILTQMATGAIIWLVDGANGIGYNGQCWRYPALCLGQESKRPARYGRETVERWLDSL